jgi:hypothetical protein
MALPLSITLNITGEASAKDYRYAPSMSIFDSPSAVATDADKKYGNKSKDDVINKVPSQLFVPFAIRITRADIVKGGEFVDPKKVTDVDLIRALGSEASAVRVLDYAEARTGKKGTDLNESLSSGVLKDNVDTVMQLVFKDGRQLKLQSDVYTIYTSKLVSWKLNQKTARTGASVSVVVDVSVVRGKQISRMKKQRLLCPGRREALRESIKKVFKKDLLGDPAKKPLKVVPRRLIQSRSRTQSSSSRPSRYLSNEDLRRLRLLYPYDPRYARPTRRSSSSSRSASPSSSPSSRTPSSSTTTPSRGGGRTRRHKHAARRKSRRNRKSYVLRTWYI